MLFRKFVILLLSGFAFSCNSNWIELKYGPDIEYMGLDFVENFPKKIPALYNLGISQDNRYVHPYVWLKFKLESIDLDSLKLIVEERAIGIYDSDDTCLLTIDQHLSTDNWRSFNKTQYRPKDITYDFQDCMIERLPVPNFYDEFWEETPDSATKLTGYTMYVLEAEKGMFLEESKLPPVVYTPPGWDHGISKGVAINEETGDVIYWADVW